MEMTWFQVSRLDSAMSDLLFVSSGRRELEIQINRFLRDQDQWLHTKRAIRCIYDQGI